MKCSLCEDCGWVCESHRDRRGQEGLAPLTAGTAGLRRTFDDPILPTRSEAASSVLKSCSSHYLSLPDPKFISAYLAIGLFFFDAFVATSRQFTIAER